MHLKKPWQPNWRMHWRACLLALAMGLGASFVSAQAVAPMVASSGWRTCALASGGEVFCWGREIQGGPGPTAPPLRLLPTRVEGLPSVQRLAVGAYHACAIAQSDARLWCWGEGNYGALGMGDSETSFLPRPVPGIETAADVVVGVTHTCVLLADGRVLCWGGNYGGALGDGLFAATFQPGPQVGIPRARALVAPHIGTCAITVTDELWCWGGQDMSSVLNPAPQVATKPVHIKGVGAVAEGFGVLESLVCARRVAMGWLCVNLRRLIDAKLRIASAMPPLILEETAAPFEAQVHVPPATTTGLHAAFYRHGRDTCHLLAAGALCAKEWSLSPPDTRAAAGVAQVFEGANYCALTISGHVKCGGNNQFGQLGLGHTSEVEGMQWVLSPDGREPFNLWTHAPSAAALTQAKAVFAQLESRFAADLPKAAASDITMASGLLLRHYPGTQAYLGASLGAPQPRLMYLGPASQGLLIDLGPLADAFQ